MEGGNILNPLEVREFIEKNGLKSGWVAKQTDIHYVIFSDFLCNRRILNQNQIFRIKDFMSKYHEKNTELKEMII